MNREPTPGTFQTIAVYLIVRKGMSANRERRRLRTFDRDTTEQASAPTPDEIPGLHALSDQVIAIRYPRHPSNQSPRPELRAPGCYPYHLQTPKSLLYHRRDLLPTNQEPQCNLPLE